jgi:hypothetical protein
MVQVRPPSNMYRGSTSEHLLLPIFILNCLKQSLNVQPLHRSRCRETSARSLTASSGLLLVGYSVLVRSQPDSSELAPTWSTIIVTLWGIVATYGGGCRSISFYMVRLALGVTEAGSFPGTGTILTKFPPDKHITP